MSLNKKHLNTIIIWALLLLTVVLWGQFFLFPKHRNVVVESATEPPTLVTRVTTRPPLSSYHLFGASATTETPLNLSVSGETGLDLIITGIFASNEENLGQAYIRQPGGDEKMFQVGDRVFDQAQLSAVYPDYVLLNRNGINEKLSLSKNRVQTTPKTVGVSNVKQSTADVDQRNRQFINSSGNWQEALNKTKFDPNKIAKLAGKVSVVRNNTGQIAGLKVSALSGNDALLKQGLQQNDRITSVNGVPISTSNILTIRQQLEQNEQATVTVNRNGREISLNLNLNELQQ